MITLPIVLLGIRTTLKEDLHSTTAELVYGMILRPLGEFFNKSQNPVDPASYVSSLKSTMQHLQATPPHSSQRLVYISPALSTRTHVFNRHS